MKPAASMRHSVLWHGRQAEACSIPGSCVQMCRLFLLDEVKSSSEPDGKQWEASFLPCTCEELLKRARVPRVDNEFFQTFFFRIALEDTFLFV